MSQSDILVVQSLLDLATRLHTARKYANSADPLAAFTDDAIKYLDALGDEQTTRADIARLIKTTRDLRNHALFTTRLPSVVVHESNGVEPPPVAKQLYNVVDIESGTDSSREDEIAEAKKDHVLTVLRIVVDRVHTQIISGDFMDESLPHQDTFFVSIPIQYTAAIHEELMNKLKRLYSESRAQTEPIRPIFMKPFIVNLAQVSDRNQDFAVRLFFTFRRDPRPFIEQVRASPN